MKKTVLGILTAAMTVSMATGAFAQTKSFSYSINKNGNNGFTINTSSGDFDKLPSEMYIDGKYYTFTYNTNSSGTQKPDSGNCDTSTPDDDSTKPETKPGEDDTSSENGGTAPETKPGDDNTSSGDEGTTPETKPEDDNNQTPETTPDDDVTVPETKPDDDNTSSGNGSGNNNQSGSASLSAYEQEVLDLVNAERAKYGLSALSADSKVQAAAEIRAEEIKSVFSHTRPNGTKFSTALTQVGATFRGAGENIASGQRTPEQVVNAWMNSEGHRANILNEKYKYLGVGCVSKGGSYAWVQIFTY